MRTKQTKREADEWTCGLTNFYNRREGKRIRSPWCTDDIYPYSLCLHSILVSNSKVIFQLTHLLGLHSAERYFPSMCSSVQCRVMASIWMEVLTYSSSKPTLSTHTYTSMPRPTSPCIVTFGSQSLLSTPSSQCFLWNWGAVCSVQLPMSLIYLMSLSGKETNELGSCLLFL